MKYSHMTIAYAKEREDRGTAKVGARCFVNWTKVMSGRIVKKVIPIKREYKGVRAPIPTGE